jgi:hypothetical protein
VTGGACTGVVTQSSVEHGGVVERRRGDPRRLRFDGAPHRELEEPSRYQPMSFARRYVVDARPREQEGGDSGASDG